MDHKIQQPVIDNICYRLNKKQSDSLIDSLLLRLRSIFLTILGLAISANTYIYRTLEGHIFGNGRIEVKLQAVNYIRKVYKPLIRMKIGLGLESVCLMALSSISLMIAALFNAYSFRYFAVPAIMIIGMEIVSGISDTMVATVLFNENLSIYHALSYTAASIFWISIEVALWLAVSKFFERNPPLGTTLEDDVKLDALKPFSSQENFK